MNKFPLAFVVTAQVVVKPHAADTDTKYENVDQEMTAWAPHDQYLYGADNKTLRHILHDDLKDHTYYPSIRFLARTQNGWAAYLIFVIHNEGEYCNHTVLEESEDNPNNILYTEEKLNFTFDRFVKIHISAHNDMLLVPDYVVPNPATRVRKLLSNIRINNPTLLSSIASVQTSMTLRNDLKLTMDALQLAIKATNMTTS